MNCPECSAEMVLRNSRYGRFYGCSTFPVCKATHGAHPNGEPLGFPANKELKLLRMKAHNQIELLFGKWSQMTKTDKKQMYIWLRNNTKSGHIAKMGKEEIFRLLKKIEQKHTEGLSYG